MDEKEFRGLLGESLTESILNKNIDIYKHVIRDLVIPAENNKTTQIDNILITSKRIFVIENKNFNGIVKSNSNGEWYTILNKEKYNLNTNPIIQNKYHVDCLKRLLNKDDDIFYSLIVLGYNCKNEVFIHDSSNISIIKIDELQQKILDILINDEQKLSHEEMDDIYLKLKYKYSQK